MAKKVNNTRYRDGEFVKLRENRHNLLYVIPSKIYDDNEYSRFSDIYFKRVILEHETAYIIDELLNKVYWLGKKDINGKYPHPLTQWDKRKRTPEYQNQKKLKWIKEKVKIATDKEYKEYRQKILRKSADKRTEFEKTDPEGIKRKAERLEQLRLDIQKGGIYYEEHKQRSINYVNHKAAVKRAQKKYRKKKQAERLLLKEQFKENND